MSVEIYTDAKGERSVKWDGPGMGSMKLANVPEILHKLQAYMQFVGSLKTPEARAFMADRGDRW